MELGLCQCEADSNLCIPLRSSYFLLLYVDDVIPECREYDHAIIQCERLGYPHFFSVKNELFDGQIKLSRSRHLNSILECFNMTDCNGIQLPLKDERLTKIY